MINSAANAINFIPYFINKQQPILINSPVQYGKTLRKYIYQSLLSRNNAKTGIELRGSSSLIKKLESVIQNFQTKS